MAIKQTRRSISVRGATYEALRADCGERNISISDHIEQLIAADFDDRGISIGGDKAPAAALHCSGKRCACASCSSVLKRAKLSAPRVQGCRARLIEALQQEPTREFALVELEKIKTGSPGSLRAMLSQLANDQLAAHGSRRGLWRAGPKLIESTPLPRESSIRVGVPAAQQRLPMPAPAPVPAPARPAAPARTTPSTPDPWSVWSVSALRPAPQTAAKHSKAATVARALPGGTDDPARSGRSGTRTKVDPPAAARGPTNVLSF